MKRTVDVWEFNGIGLIIKCPSGVCISNQTGGYACHHPEVEGVFVPLLADRGAPSNTVLCQLERFFTEGKWGGWCENGIDAETADFMDSLLASSDELKFIKVDRALLADSEEAWVHVILDPSRNEMPVPVMDGFEDGTAAVLTWPNSD